MLLYYCVNNVNDFLLHLLSANYIKMHYKDSGDEGKRILFMPGIPIDK